MKKLLALFAAIALTLTLTACGGEAKLPAQGEIDMTNVDEYLNRENVQYVDLRNFDDKLNKGYIAGFEFIPFFDYLQAEGIITGQGDTTAVGDATRLEALFDKDAEAIFLMCQSGGRAGWVKAALESLDYTNVYNVTGFGTYEGNNVVTGDGSYVLENEVYGTYTPGVYVASAPADSHGNVYFVVLTISANGGIEALYIDSAVPGEEGSTKQTLGDAYNMVAFSDPTAIAEWYVQANTLSAAIVANQGFDAAWATDGLAGVSIGYDEIEVAFNAALVLAE
ncbi:hypothetical protein KQ51_00798 [Candidatus Izimaplasma bacterium HR1]|jgi:rhodanese-related sulfurtransferase|uniref:rhodanese-like domain-containing protein n=1 Tax=Candidatus Izimoplasma sp. HR1 TaxID=1541959 RepID=UPI0004F8D46E|nr:hypothetical protein KQ51_00798 [Candidatus Izimaplasma bacterium HR1]